VRCRHRDLDSDGKINLSEFEMTTHHELEQRLGEHPEPHEAMEGAGGRGRGGTQRRQGGICSQAL